MRVGLGILQILVMKVSPSVMKQTWSPILKKIATCKPTCTEVAEYLLTDLKKKDLHDEIRVFIEANLQHITPTTVWLLE